MEWLEFKVVQSEAVSLEENLQGATPIPLQSVLFAGRLEITCLESFLSTLEGWVLGWFRWVEFIESARAGTGQDVGLHSRANGNHDLP